MKTIGFVSIILLGLMGCPATCDAETYDIAWNFKKYAAAEERSSLAVCDINEDGLFREAVVASGGAKRLTAIDNTGQVLWEVDLPEPFQRMVAADLDKDGMCSDVVGLATSNKLYAYDNSGKRLWSYDHKAESASWVCRLQAVDLDGDGKLSGVVAALMYSFRGSKGVIAVGSKGDLLWSYDIGRIYSIWADHRMVLVGGNEVVALGTATGKELFDPISIGVAPVRSVGLVDFRKDGNLTIVAGGEGGMVYLDTSGKIRAKRSDGPHENNLGFIEGSQERWAVFGYGSRIAAFDKDMKMRRETSGGSFGYARNMLFVDLDANGQRDDPVIDKTREGGEALIVTVFNGESFNKVYDLSIPSVGKETHDPPEAMDLDGDGFLDDILVGSTGGNFIAVDNKQR